MERVRQPAQTRAQKRLRRRRCVKAAIDKTLRQQGGNPEFLLQTPRQQGPFRRHQPAVLHCRPSPLRVVRIHPGLGRPRRKTPPPADKCPSNERASSQVAGTIPRAGDPASGMARAGNIAPVAWPRPPGEASVKKAKTRKAASGSRCAPPFFAVPPPPDLGGAGGERRQTVSSLRGFRARRISRLLNPSGPPARRRFPLRGGG